MRNRIFLLCLALLFALSSAASAASLPAITDGRGQPVTFSAAETDAEAPVPGDWNLYTEAVSGLDAQVLDMFRTLMAVKATEMDFNTYLMMTYAEKASVALALQIADVEEGAEARYGEGDAALPNAVFPVFIPAAGDFAAIALVDGAWVNVGMFSLTGDAASVRASYLIDLSCYDIGDSPAYLVRFNESEGAWRVVGLNQAYVDAAIALTFY